MRWYRRGTDGGIGDGAPGALVWRSGTAVAGVKMGYGHGVSHTVGGDWFRVSCRSFIVNVTERGRASDAQDGNPELPLGIMWLCHEDASLSRALTLYLPPDKGRQ